MASSRRKFAIWACILGTATLTVGIGVATGAKKLKTKSQTVEVDSLENGTATARCAQGTKAVSGGFEAEFDETDFEPAFYMYESRRAGGREWSSTGLNVSGQSGDLTSFAYCRDQKLKTKSKTTEVDVGDLDSVTARCKQGEKAFSGGFAAEEIDINAPTTPVFLPTESLKQGKREWRVSAVNAGSEEGDLTAYVYCRQGKGVKTKQADETLSNNEFDSVEARCSRKQRVVSGGFDLDANWTTTGSYGMESLKVGKRGWEVAALGIGQPHDLIAYAYCEKKKKKG
jgi:hypothetical protein